METLYDILEVSRKASKEVIEKAYKTLAKKYHPDLQTPENKAIAEEKMKKINEAYSILIDESKRQEYDEKLEQIDEQNKVQNNLDEQENNNKAQYNYAQNYTKHYTQTYKNNPQANHYESASNNTKVNQQFEDWKKAYASLSRREQIKLKRKIEREANEEYRKRYEEYFRSLGYKVKHKRTFKDYLSMFITIITLVLIFLILWWIPASHSWMVKMYNENIAIQIIVNIIIGIFGGIAKFIKNI